MVRASAASEDLFGKQQGPTEQGFDLISKLSHTSLLNNKGQQNKGLL
jgi:hypothetical protein